MRKIILLLILILLVSCAKQSYDQSATSYAVIDTEEQNTAPEPIEETQPIEELEEEIEETPEQDEFTIDILDGGIFNQTDITIKAGQKIRWFNKDNKVHMVIGLDEKFKGTRISPLESFVYKFNNKGVKRFKQGIITDLDDQEDDYKLMGGYIGRVTVE